MAENDNQVHYPSSVSLTPRYDWKWIGVYIPMSYNEYGNFGAGFGARLGHCLLPHSNLITVLAGKTTFAADTTGRCQDHDTNSSDSVTMTRMAI
jgi:hypothetical protein